MSTTLGQAYVQIMPSAKGISGSIQKTLNPEATKAGKSAGANLAKSMADSMNKSGKKLTKAITMPVLGATTAVAGLVGTLGWKRLTGLDSARAKLRGLGYEAEAVDRISSLVSDSIQGTVTTMAEGVSIAAGGLAAGVKEGADLERYIKLVGDAAVGAGRDVGSMAQIFNRVQGGGRLMTQELNMIEDGMPGFAQAMAKSLGVPLEEFRKMVTEGKVSSTQFLDVMEDFAGDMSDAYADSWDGIVSRTKSNIGILGETMLGGVFEQSKESLAEFLEFIRTDDVRGWFEDAGVAIGNAFSNAIESVKGAITWWINLDSETKQLIGRIVGIAVAIGPVLLIASKLITAIMGVVSAIGAISAPVLIAAGAIVGLIALFTTLYQSNEEFRGLVQSVWETVQEVFFDILEFLQETWTKILAFWEEHGEMILNNITAVLTEIWGYWEHVFGIVRDFIEEVLSWIVPFVEEMLGKIMDYWNENGDQIMEAVQNVFDWLKEAWDLLYEVIMPIVELMWNQIKTQFETALNVILGLVDFFIGLFTGDWDKMKEAALGIVEDLWDGVKGLFSNAWDFVKEPLAKLWNNISDWFTGLKDDAVEWGSNMIDGFVDGIKSVPGKVADAAKSVVSGVGDFLKFWSPAKKGEGRYITHWGANMVDGFLDGVKSEASEAGKVMNDLVEGMKPSRTISLDIDDGADGVQKAMNKMLTVPFNPSIKDEIGSGTEADNNDVRSLLMELIDAVKEGQNISLFPDGGTFAKKTGKYTSFEGGNRVRRAERGLA